MSGSRVRSCRTEYKYGKKRGCKVNWRLFLGQHASLVMEVVFEQVPSRKADANNHLDITNTPRASKFVALVTKSPTGMRKILAAKAQALFDGKRSVRGTRQGKVGFGPKHDVW